MDGRIRELLPILRCPRTHGALQFDDGKLFSDRGGEYPIIDGKPILVRFPEPHHLSPPAAAHISQNQARYIVEERCSSSPRRCLHLGSGNVPCADPRVVSFDLLPCEHVDIVGEAEELPFQDDVFDLVDSGAVFEHLRDPLRAINEVKRVTAPGGIYLIDTAFLQSYHGFPGHYFNLTPLAVESFLVDDFILEQSVVPGSATPERTLLDLSERFLAALPKEERVRLERMAFRDLLEALKEAPFRDQLLQHFSEYSKRSLAASFVIAARKPAGWKPANLLGEQEPALAEEFQLARRTYYELRMTVILRHHEVLLYKRLCRENGVARDPMQPNDPEPISALLMRCMPADVLSPEAFLAANEALRGIEAELRSSRDAWINLYLGASST